jgi:hypothetical protein
MSISKQGINEDILQKAGYRNFGWMNGRKENSIDECIKSKHTISELSYSEAKNLCYCDECKIYWFYDCSD